MRGRPPREGTHPSENDTAVLPGRPDAPVSTLSKRPDAGAVGACGCFWTNDLQEGAASSGTTGSAGITAVRTPRRRTSATCAKSTTVPAPASCPKRIFHDLGGFDPRDRRPITRTDFCFCLREQGYSVLYQLSAHVVDLEGATAGTDESSGVQAVSMRQP